MQEYLINNETLHAVTETLVGFSVSAHQYFVAKVWPKNPNALTWKVNGVAATPCYHSEHHIFGATYAAAAITNSIENTDPFAIKNELQRWNEKNNSEITLDEFSEILQIVFATHDLGNLTKTDQITMNNGEITLDYADSFQLELTTTEERSAQIALKLIAEFDPQRKITEPMKRLLKHLIMQTVFRGETTQSEEPFWLVVQTVDQIGTHYFSNYPIWQAVSGILNEQFALPENKRRQQPNLKPFLNFLPNRLAALFPNAEIRKEILAIFDPENKKSSIMNQIAAEERPIQYDRDIKEMYLGKYHKNVLLQIFSA